jgi:hypothetical protein
MNFIKRILGIVWMLLGFAAGYYLLVSQAFPKFATGSTEDLVPAIIYCFILAPIIVGGMFVFGLYAMQGEYNQED